MTGFDPFKPPAAAVQDVGAAPTPSFAPSPVVAAVFVSAALLHLLWLSQMFRSYLVFTRDGVLWPIGLFPLVIGLLFFYAGLACLVVTGLRGGRFLLMAAAWHALALVAWHSILAWPSDARFAALRPIVLGMVIAVAGWAVARRRTRARQGTSP